MDKITFQELAEGLAARKSITKKDSDAFVRMFFDTIKACLQNDPIVKVKGLGTFKLITVDRRESVNVNTGERFIIDSHPKLTFTPDKALADRVNKPFADFETVILNESTRTEDMERMPEPEPEGAPALETVIKPEIAPEPVPVETTQEVEEPAVVAEEEPVAISEPEPVPTPEPEAVVEPESIPEPVIVPEQTSEPDSLVRVEPTPVAEENPAPPVESFPVEEEKKGSHGWWLLLLLALVAALLIWLFFGKRTDMSAGLAQETQAEQTDTKSEEPTEDAATDVEPAEPVVPAKSVEELAADYPQIEGGEYWIVGTKATHVLAKGDDLSKLALEHYGDKRLINYIIKYNHYTASQASNLYVGTEVKLPELVRRED